MNHMALHPDKSLYMLIASRQKRLNCISKKQNVTKKKESKVYCPLLNAKFNAPYYQKI